jgi:putative ABC transport system permease protein
MFTQTLTAISLALSTLPTRKGASLVVVIGMACAIGALVSTQSLSAGINETINRNGRADRAIVMSRGSTFEFSSSLPRDNLNTIGDAPGVKHGAGGKPLATGDAIAIVPVVKKSDGYQTFLAVFGGTSEAMGVRPEVHLISGRMFQPGKYEVIVGKAAAQEFVGLAEGTGVSLPDGDWTIVGSYEANGGSMESALLTDADTLNSSMRNNTYKGVTVMLESATALDSFKAALTSNPTLTVDVMRETDYIAQNLKQLNGLLGAVAAIVGVTMGLGAMFGALNTMYSAVSARAREIATLRAIGFDARPVLISVLVEALALSLLGALIGTAVAWLAFNGNLHVIGGTVINLAVTPGLVRNGFLFAGFLGFVGGFFPALRAARRPIAEALRAS